MKKICIVALLLLTSIHTWASGADYSQYHYQPTVKFNTWWGVANLVVKVMDKHEVMADVEVGVFTKGDEPVLRGMAQYNSQDGVWWITIHGDEEEAMEFHLWDNATGQEKIVDSDWVFQPYGTQGTKAEPYMLYWNKPRDLYENSVRINVCSLKKSELDDDGIWPVTADLYNPNEYFSGVQFNLTLPAGVKIMDEDGLWLDQTPRTSTEKKSGKKSKPIFDMPEATDMGEGTYFVYINAAIDDETIQGTEGSIIEIDLAPDDNFTDGLGTLSITDVYLMKTDGSTVKGNDYTATVLMGSQTDFPGGTITIEGQVTPSALTEITSNESLAVYDLSNAILGDGCSFSPANKNALLFIDADDKEKITSPNVIADNMCDELILTDGYEFYSPTFFSASKATYDRELTGLGTICLPFEPSTDGYEYYELNSDNGTTLGFAKVDIPEANRPYLYKKTGTEAIVSFDVFITGGGADYVALDGSWTMQGTYSNVTLTSDDNAYALSGGKIYHNAGTLKMKPFRAYFTREGSGDVKSVGVTIDGETAILDADVDRLTVNSQQPMYNLAGQVVDGNYRGIVIRNGVKLIKR